MVKSLEIKQMQNLKLADNVICNSGSPNKQKDQCEAGSLVLSFRDLFFAHLGAMPLPNGERLKDSNLDDNVKEEGLEDYTNVIESSCYPQKIFIGSADFVNLGLLPNLLNLGNDFDAASTDKENEIETVNTVNIVDQITDEDQISLDIIDVLKSKKIETPLVAEKSQVRYPVIGIKGQEESLINAGMNHGVNLLKEVIQINEENKVNQVDKVDVVNQKEEITQDKMVNQNMDKTLNLRPVLNGDSELTKKLEINKGYTENQVKEEVQGDIFSVNRNKSVQENLPLHKEIIVREGLEIKADHEIEVSFPYQKASLEDVSLNKPQDLRKMGLEQLPQQIEKLFQQVSIEKKQHSWKLQLEPENLGKLKIVVNWEQGKISAEFHVETSQVAKALESYLDNLKQNLGQKNIDVTSISIMITGQGGGGFENTPNPFSKKEKGFVLRDDSYTSPAQEEGDTIIDGKSVNYLV